ncbi:hypothetical protein [Streptomyces daqingensis]|uniref:hypothetical protein n=1 Tax=Streptomyces daqingensis TaxID=1472640 RepID=UPI001E2CB647|nr:hypothetical protein [Streptomyces daqingensis]
MGEFVAYLAVAASLAAVMAFFGWLAAVARRRGVAGRALSDATSVVCEPFYVTAHESHHEVKAQAARKAPVPSPGDQPGAFARASGLPLPRRGRRTPGRFARRVRRLRGGGR